MTQLKFASLIFIVATLAFSVSVGATSEASYIYVSVEETNADAIYLIDGQSAVIYQSSDLFNEVFLNENSTGRWVETEFFDINRQGVFIDSKDFMWALSMFNDSVYVLKMILNSSN